MSEFPFDDDIAAYYAEGREASRLIERPDGRLEFLRTQELLARHLPPPPATILDVGGGTGIHALPLAKSGYEVHLVDPVQRHIDQALEASERNSRPLASAQLGDARSLAQDGASVDGVLLLGPLYHLPARGDRLLALREAFRVLRPGGVLLAAAISRFAPLLDWLHRGVLGDPELQALVESNVRTGRHSNPARRPGLFTTAYFHATRRTETRAKAGGVRGRYPRCDRRGRWVAI